MVTPEQIETLRTLSEPLISFINENLNPHSEIVIDSSSARIMSGECLIIGKTVQVDNKEIYK